MYIAMTQLEANLCFHLIYFLDRKSSMTLTSNKNPVQRCELMRDQGITTMIWDYWKHRVDVVQMEIEWQTASNFSKQIYKSHFYAWLAFIFVVVEVPISLQFYSTIANILAIMITGVY